MVKCARKPVTKYNGKTSKYNSKTIFAAKTPPQTMIFHQKTSKTIDFSRFSLSKLYYSKSQQPTCLPRGRSPPLGGGGA